MKKEQRDFPNWEIEAPDYESIRCETAPDDVLMTSTDFYVCPSVNVRDDLVSNWDVDAERTTVVPYSVSPQWPKFEPEPQRGRVLFVGTAGLGKGIHYLAWAAEKLHQRGYRYQFRVAGNVADSVRRQPACRHLTFLGRVPRSRIHEEFQQADVFALPSLAEGSAEVTYEALAAGVPLVVTPAAGSVARDGIDGCLVPERDPAALVEAIAGIVEDREKRTRMACAAVQRALDFTPERYAERLVNALQKFETQRTGGSPFGNNQNC